MTKTSPQQIVEKLKLTLSKNNIDYERYIAEMGQVEAAERRLRGEEFLLDEHIACLIFALLSSQRPWGPIQEHSAEIEEIFSQYNPDKLQKADPIVLLQKILNIKCGNKRIKFQINSLNHNIEIFKRIIKKFGSIDKFVTSKNGEEIAALLAGSEKYKLKEVGFALAAEYLKNVGVMVMKPDSHLLDICGSDKLEIFSSNFPKEKEPSVGLLIELLKEFNRFAQQANLNPTYLDNLLWILCAEDYANICSAKPKCNLCELALYCNYPKNNHKNEQDAN